MRRAGMTTIVLPVSLCSLESISKAICWVCTKAFLSLMFPLTMIAWDILEVRKHRNVFLDLFLCPLPRRLERQIPRNKRHPVI